VGVEAGLVAGVLVSLLLFLLKTSRPHIAEVGLVSGTEHFRNVLRHQVRVDPQLLSLRVDESLYFANARALEDRINQEVAKRPKLQHVVLQCSAINDIDASALESLEAIDHRLKDARILLHLSEVKGPVMDRLKSSQFLSDLGGRVFLTHYQAVQQLAPELIAAAALQRAAGALEVQQAGPAPIRNR
jgi:SulP family sulfate permease